MLKALMGVNGNMTQDDLSGLRRDEGHGRMRSPRCSQSLERLMGGNLPRGLASSEGQCVGRAGTVRT